MRRLWIFGLQLISTYSAILPPPWADPSVNPCAAQPGGWLKIYWPKDGRCYRIFQRGAPCPDTMELTPGSSEAECRCPPGQIQTHEESRCHQIYSKGPCKWGQFLAPIENGTRTRWGQCTDPSICQKLGQLYWPSGKKCYEEHSRGPCPVGQIFAFNNDTGLPECSCEAAGPLSRYYWPPTKSCHQFYTRGPCLEKGALFLPGPKCGCHTGLPNYHVETEQCYEIGGPGPCKTGHIFELQESKQAARCVCKLEHVPWFDGHCYRVYTQGPCPQGKFIIPSGICQELPCTRGMLYFPQEDACYRLGVRGPCPQGQLVLFEQSVEGISYRGMCGCPASESCSIENTNEQSRNSQPKALKHKRINSTAGTLCEMNDDEEICHQLYTQGPCQNGEWLVPSRQGRTKRRTSRMQIPSAVGVYIGHRFNQASSPSGHIKTLADDMPHLYPSENKDKERGRCECRTGYTKTATGTGCHLPLVELAKFLNGQDYFK